MSRLETLNALQHKSTKAPISVRLYGLWEVQHVVYDLRSPVLDGAVTEYFRDGEDLIRNNRPIFAREIKAALKEDDLRISGELDRRKKERQRQVECNLQLAERIKQLPQESIQFLPKNIKRHLQMNTHGWEMWESGMLHTLNYLDLLLSDGARLNEILEEHEKKDKSG